MMSASQNVTRKVRAVTDREEDLQLLKDLDGVGWQTSDDAKLVLVDGSMAPDRIGAAIRSAQSAGGVALVLLSRCVPSEVAPLLRQGADGFLLRPARSPEVAHRLEEERRGLVSAQGRARASNIDLSQVVLDAPALDAVVRLLVRGSASKASVLLAGETGTGKEIVARALHRLSPRRHEPFVALSCAALPEELLAAELFGAEKGAFTGATQSREGRFERAHGGTLFLDEIGEVPENTQVKLLRVLQEQTFERLGSNQPVHVDVRVVAATNRPLDEAVAEGRFRQDLLYRLRVLSVRMPNLRERPRDLLRLWQTFVGELAEQEGRAELSSAPALTKALLAHDWPGNIRELRNAAHHAVTLAVGDSIEADVLPGSILGSRPRIDDLRVPGMTLREIERAAILRTYSALGSTRATADALGVSVRTIQYRLKDYREEGIDIEMVGRSEPDRPETDSERVTRLLLAEDDDEVRGLLQEVLSAEGFSVTAVSDGASLLERLGACMFLDEEGPPDVIITDLRMPGLHGLKLLEGVNAGGWQVPIIVVSAFGDTETRARAQRLGAAAFFDKPVNVESLCRMARQLAPEARVWN